MVQERSDRVELCLDPQSEKFSAQFDRRQEALSENKSLTSGRGSGVVGYNVQVAVDIEHHLIVTHEVTNCGSDRAQLSNIASQVKDVLGVDKLEAIADRGYFKQILACDRAGITVTLPSR
jgi:hypothetical protein